jgi:hypothetical protein
MTATSKRAFRLDRDLGEASLVNVARRARVEGVWVYRDGEFRDVSERQDPTRATFVVQVEGDSPFTVYHIHPAKVGTPGGHIDVHRGYKLSPPSLDDFASYALLRDRYGALVSCKVADGWGIWSFGLTEEALRDGLVRRLTDKQIFLWIRDAYVERFRFRLPPSAAALRAFRADLQARGFVIDYVTREELYAKVAPKQGKSGKRIVGSE